MASQEASRRPGRPPALDATKREVVVALVAAGWPRSRAARYVGVSPQTVLNTAGRDSEFAGRLDRAEAELRRDHLTNLAAVSGRSWRASAWALERLAPDRFSPRVGAAEALEAFRRVLCEEIADEPLREWLLRRLEALVRRGR